MTRKKTPTKEPQTFQTEVKPKISKKEQISQIIKSRTKNKFLSKGQEEYYDKLTENQITICSGPAGVGKSYIAIQRNVIVYSLYHCVQQS